MQTASKTNLALCPDCERQIKVGGDPKIGKRILCPHCEAFLRIISLGPLELDWDLDDYDDLNLDDDEWDTDDDWR